MWPTFEARALKHTDAWEEAYGLLDARKSAPTVLSHLLLAAKRGTQTEVVPLTVAYAWLQQMVEEYDLIIKAWVHTHPNNPCYTSLRDIMTTLEHTDKDSDVPFVCFVSAPQSSGTVYRKAFTVAPELTLAALQDLIDKHGQYANLPHTYVEVAWTESTRPITVVTQHARYWTTQAQVFSVFFRQFVAVAHKG